MRGISYLANEDDVARGNFAKYRQCLKQLAADDAIDGVPVVASILAVMNRFLIDPVEIQVYSLAILHELSTVGMNKLSYPVDTIS